MKIKNKTGNNIVVATMRKTNYTSAAYDKAKTNEFLILMELLSELCSRIEEPEYKFGRPKLPLRDMVFASVLKVYSTFSLRRFMSYMQIAKEKGYVSTVCSYSSISNVMRKTDVMPILNELIKLTSLPLVDIERHFAVDGSGFSMMRFNRWYEHKWLNCKKYKVWLKLHITVGAITKIITSARVAGGTSSDTKYLPEMIEETAENFSVEKVSADKAYSSRKNIDCITKIGAEALIPFKKNATGNSRGSYNWMRLFLYFKENQDEFYAKYSRRNSVEVAYHMIKANSGDSLKSRDRTAQENELLCKVVCHNIAIVIQWMFELAIEPGFTKTL